MTSQCNVFVVFAILVSCYHCGDGARILGLFPTASISHQIVFRKLTLELNKRGHELVVLTTDPVRDPTLKNYTEIDISFLYEKVTLIGNIVDYRGKFDWFDMVLANEPKMRPQIAQVFGHPELKKLYEPNSGEKFDLILMEIFITPIYLALGERFKAPVIGIASTTLQIHLEYGIGNPILSSHPSNWGITETAGASWMLWERLKNFVKCWKHIHYMRTVVLSNQQEIAEKFLGTGVSNLADLEKNISLIFVNQQGPISFAKPSVPNVIEIGGMHVPDTIKPLPTDLQKTLDEASQGFIYMSLGSNVKSNMLSEKTRDAFITAFSKLPYKVIWKFEDDQLKGKPDNVIILKWAPQQAILAHHNIKLFIYQGGLQSTEEAISHGVPLVGIPIMGDQDTNVKKMVSLGVAKSIEITDTNADDILLAIRSVALDDSYKQRMLSLRFLIKDRPYDTLENAIWWTEHVIRHRGAPYLLSTTANDPWYQRQDVDIIAFLSATFVTILILVLLITYKCIIYNIKAFRYRPVNKKEKRNYKIFARLYQVEGSNQFYDPTNFGISPYPLYANPSDWHFGDAARILAVFPTASISHQIVFRKLTLELNKRGHELVVVTPDPVNDPTLKNYTEIDVSFQYNDKDSLPNIIGMRGKVDWFGWLKVQVPMITRQVTKIFEQPDLKKLYHPNSGEKFDLILMQMFFTPAFMSFAARFKAPMIGIHSASLQTSMQYAIGNPILHSDPSNWQLDMKFPESSWIPWRRLDNFIQSWRFIHYHRTVYLPKQQKIAEKYLGIDIPDLHDLEKNISLIFVNQQGPISFAKPNVPKVIDIGGFHVTNKIKPLPKDLKKVLDEATQGFVYMSLGSNVHSKMLPEKARKDIVAAFSKLPYKVIWKFEDDTLKNLPENVIILKWTPQQAVLAHPNIKVFIYQGGLQSTEEAVSNGVPLIGLPVMSDQDMNVRKMESVGVAKKLEITNINEKDFFEAVRTVAGDDGYKQRMLNLRSLLKDKPYNMLENAVWWTEHVIRHRGAPYLHSTTADQPWYQRQDMDIERDSVCEVVSAKMSWRVIFIVFTLLASDWHFGDAARILAVLPTASVSHQVVFQKLMLELNKRGHELVVVTPNPVNDPTLKNYTEIDISFQYSDKDTLPNIINLRGNVDWFGLLKVFEPMLSKHAVQIFEHPELKKLYDPNSGEEFDLILMQMFITPAFMSFAARFKAPMIGIVSASLQTSVQYAIGNPILHSDPSNWQLDMKSPGSSWIPWRRLDNFIQSWRFIHYHRTVILPKYQKIAEKYLGIDIPDLHDLEKNVSLIFVNQQGPISFAKPNVPKVIEIGGFHVADKIKPLPKDLKKVLDEATQGFVYMSLGSNIQSNMLPEKARKDIVAAFSKLPYKVIWKFEDDTLKNLPENVIILKWTPQQAVLAHPNIKVFIYQGGLQSTEEAVSNGVPLIGLPVMSDQDMNVRKMESVGVAKKLEITNINEKDFFEAVRTVAGDDGYKQRMLNLRSLLKDKPHDMLENAVWWTEHVIRHRGAPHLHSTTADEPWYQRQDMDIIAFLSAMFVILSILSVFIFYKCVILSIRLASHPTVEKSKKRN
ncbi:uncharacterized protein LOC124186582 [Neodiprion fabricii]|uniref:uncharacterized protein LOC124186582 n=1 Tax=Neodiprion fabricii TaxID=2872261 RepID=UPI001ED95234|nr:uncharacterized protein LOC124186582 [Neodiprion fabricii]